MKDEVTETDNKLQQERRGGVKQYNSIKLYYTVATSSQHSCLCTETRATSYFAHTYTR